MLDVSPTVDELSRGARFWNNHVRRAQAAFSRTDWTVRGWDVAQDFLDRHVNRARRIANACRTYGPCSRECVRVEAA